ncbi:uncharacterized protein LOC116851941 [Odontomachus brunneus]|uniref:uncharacterized protein LOC116851941 n=1 Tax=Odontomachus brunneus TaxID=486640 RepID=UPI0013F1DA9C|nr:uncharacterized protein LOC116851941 [Odontomachus brunneus]
MQISVIIIFVLATAIMTYGYNVDILKKFYDNFAMCNKKLCTSPTEFSVEAVHCALLNDGEMINVNGEFTTNIVLRRLGDYISEASRLERARAIHITCRKRVIKTGATGYEQTQKTIACSMPIKDLIDKMN